MSEGYNKHRRSRKRVTATPVYTKLGKDETGLFEFSTLHDENPYPSVRALNHAFVKSRYQDGSKRVTMWDVHSSFNSNWLDTARGSMNQTDTIVFIRYKKDTRAYEQGDTILLQDTHTKKTYSANVMDVGTDIDNRKRTTSHMIFDRPELV
jgi:hypothetical protein